MRGLGGGGEGERGEREMKAGRVKGNQRKRERERERERERRESARETRSWDGVREIDSAYEPWLMSRGSLPPTRSVSPELLPVPGMGCRGRD